MVDFFLFIYYYLLCRVLTPIITHNIKEEKMSINLKNKQDIIKEYGANEKDTGSVEVQIAMLSQKIIELTEHLKNNKQDKHSTRGLNQMVSQRKKLLDYLASVDINRARAIKSKLGICG